MVAQPNKKWRRWQDVISDEWPWKNFSPHEMACRGTGQLVVDFDAMDKLQNLRDAIDRPIIIQSAYRTPEHNKAVGGAKRSMHLKAQAFDVSMANHNPIEFEKQARAVGFTGFGYYPKSGFMHIDTGPERSWGRRWGADATAFPIERKRSPEAITEDTETQVAVGIGATGVLAFISENLPAISNLLDQMAPRVQLFSIVALIVLAAFLIWRRSR